jgi:hypothetical protein
MSYLRHTRRTRRLPYRIGYRSGWRTARTCFRCSTPSDTRWGCIRIARCCCTAGSRRTPHRVPRRLHRSSDRWFCILRWRRSTRCTMTSSRIRKRCRRNAGRGCRSCTGRRPCRTPSFPASSRKCCRCSNRWGTRSDCRRIARRCRRGRPRTSDMELRRRRRSRCRRCCRSGSHRSSHWGKTRPCTRTFLAHCSPGRAGIGCTRHRRHRTCCRSSPRTGRWRSTPRRWYPRNCKRRSCTPAPPRTLRTHCLPTRKRSSIDWRAGRTCFPGSTRRHTKPSCIRKCQRRYRPAQFRRGRIEGRQCRIDLCFDRCRGRRPRSHCSSRWDTTMDCRRTCRSHRTFARPRRRRRPCLGFHRRRASGSRKRRCSCNSLSCTWARSGMRLDCILDPVRRRRSGLPTRHTHPGSAWERTYHSRHNNPWGKSSRCSAR